MQEIDHTTNFSSELIEFSNSIDALSDPVTRRDYFENLSDDSFIDLTQQVAALIRTGNANVLQPYDGEGVATGLMSPRTKGIKKDYCVRRGKLLGAF